jgi:cytochrome c6
MILALATSRQSEADPLRVAVVFFRALLPFCLIVALAGVAVSVAVPGAAQAAPLPVAPAASRGARLFENHCAGCHVRGGNIIRRRKTLQLKALQREGLASAEAIARVAAEGRGGMSGYGDVLGPGGAEEVGAWVWQQAQNAWTQG